MNIDFFLERFSSFMNIVCHRFHLSDILTKLGHFLKGKFSNDPTTKPTEISMYSVKSFLKSHSFQKKRRAYCTVSSGTNSADRIIINIFGVAK